MINGPRSPNRPIDWRWNRADVLANIPSNKPRRFGKFDDRWVKSALWFKLKAAKQQKSGAAGQKDEQRSRRAEEALEHSFPEIHYAEALHKAAGNERWIIEAMLLAGSTCEDIARISSYDMRTIEMYEKLFFDVRDRLNKPAYIMGRFFNSLTRKEIDETALDPVYKWIGWRYGAELLLAFILKSHSDEQQTTLNEATFSMLNTGGFLAALTRKSTGFTASDIVEQMPIMKTLTANAEGLLPAKATDIDERLTYMLSSVQLSVVTSANAPLATSEFRDGEGLKRLRNEGKSDTTVDDGDKKDEKPVLGRKEISV